MEDLDLSSGEKDESFSIANQRNYIMAYLDYDAVYFPLSGQLKHFLHRRPLEICTGVSVVHEFSDFRIPKFL